MSDELKPCPFCGGEDVEIVEHCGEFGWSYTVECLDCDCNAKQLEKSYAVAAWNRRAGEEPKR